MQMSRNDSLTSEQASWISEEVALNDMAILDQTLILNQSGAFVDKYHNFAASWKVS